MSAINQKTFGRVEHEETMQEDQRTPETPGETTTQAWPPRPRPEENTEGRKMKEFICECGRRYVLAEPEEKTVPCPIPDADPEVLIPNHLMFGYGFLDGMGIQKYLLSIKSWLAVKHCENQRLFAYYLADLCKEYDIEPIYVLAMIQREQSALFRSEAPSQHVQDKLFGYGIPDGTEDAKQTPYYGFEQQLRGAVWQLRHYANPRSHWAAKMQDYLSNGKRMYDASNWRPATLAEAATATYTPHLSAVKIQAQLLQRISQEISTIGIARPK